MVDKQWGLDAPQSPFSRWLDASCVTGGITTYAVAREYAELNAQEPLPDGRRKAGRPRGPRHYRRNANGLPKNLIKQYRATDRTPTAPVAYRIGQALRVAGALSTSGPVALYVAGHYDKLVDFLAALATKKSPDWKVGAGSFHAVKLYCVLWSSTFDMQGLRNQKIAEQTCDALGAMALAANKHLTIGTGYEALLSLYDESWQSASDLPTPELEPARVAARAERKNAFPAATWTLLQPWIKATGPKAFPHFREYLGAHGLIELLSTYPTLPVPSGGGELLYG